MADRTTFPTQYNGTAEATLDSTLAGAQAGYYTAAVLANMTVYDKIYAAKLLAKNGSLPANGVFVNPWDDDGA